MAARITRAEKKIVAAGIPLASPVGEEFRPRLDEVCRTIYLAFTAGYSPGRGPDLLRVDLAGEAVELAAVLDRLVPDASQVRALYALLLLQHARRDSRVADGALVTLADQDRSRWNQDDLRAGLALLAGIVAGEGYAEVVRLQAAIAGEHARARTASDTDWPKIVALYAELEGRTGPPVVTRNRAVAVAEVDGPQAGLALLAVLDDALSSHHRLPAVRAELARRAGDVDLARASYAQALAACDK